MADKKNSFVDEELERGFLNCVIKDPSVLDDVIDKVCAHDFYNPKYRKVFSIIQKMYFDKGSISKTKLMLKGRKDYSRDFMMEIFDADYADPVEINDIVSQLNKYRFKRQVKDAFKRGYDYLLEKDINLDELKSKIQDEIFQATSEQVGKEIVVDIEEVVMESFERFMGRQQGETRERIKTGIKSLDAMLTGGGFARKGLSILGGRPSMGKTAMALKILNSMLKTAAVPSLFFSLEMEKVELIDRMIIQESKVAADDYYLVNKSKEKDFAVTDRQRKAIDRASSWLHDKPLKITDERGLTIEDIKAIARKTDSSFDNKLGFIIIDYLTEIKINAFGGRVDKGYADAIRELRDLAGELNCHILLLHQINRDFKNRSNKRPRLSDLRDTGEAEEKIDYGLFVHRPDYYKSREDGEDEPLVQPNSELILAKQRQGKTGIMLFTWYPEILYFQDYRDFNIYGRINYLKQE
ncbi:MAG: replicative DNA helicase [Bacteroidales bacterium]